MCGNKDTNNLTGTIIAKYSPPMVGIDPATGKRQIGRPAQKARRTVSQEVQSNRQLAKQVLQQYNPQETPKRLKATSERNRRIISLYIAGAEPNTICKELHIRKSYVMQIVAQAEEEIRKWSKLDAGNLVFSVFQSVIDNYRANQVELTLQRYRLEAQRGRCLDYLDDLAKGITSVDGGPESIAAGLTTSKSIGIGRDRPELKLQRAMQAAQDKRERLQAAVKAVQQEVSDIDGRIRAIMAEQRSNDRDEWNLLSQMGVPDITMGDKKGTHTPSPDSSILDSPYVPLLTDGSIDIERIKHEEAASLRRRLDFLERGKCSED